MGISYAINMGTASKAQMRAYAEQLDRRNARAFECGQAVKAAYLALEAHYKARKQPEPEPEAGTLTEKILAAVNGSEVNFDFIAGRLPGYSSSRIGNALGQLVTRGQLEKPKYNRYRATGHN